tara:strand:- start:191 stop:379 length:189 start_codon:yes stop_codon:yes gene_type:complete
VCHYYYFYFELYILYSIQSITKNLSIVSMEIDDYSNLDKVFSLELYLDTPTSEVNEKGKVSD